jgi:hypothetical protein
MLKNRRCGGPRMHAGNSMEGAALQRKLTTILVADVAGYQPPYGTWRAPEQPDGGGLRHARPGYRQPAGFPANDDRRALPGQIPCPSSFRSRKISDARP